MRKKNLLILVFIIGLALTACSSEGTATTAPAATPTSETLANSNSDNGVSETQALDCESSAYPCSYADSDAGAVEQSFALMDEALALLVADGNMDKAAAYLEGIDEVVEVMHDEVVIFYRVENSAPMLIFHPDFGPDLSGLAAEDEATPKTAALTANITPINDGPIGPQHEGENPTKRALLLSPMLYDFGEDEISELGVFLPRYRDYQCEGCVTEISVPENPLNGRNGQLKVGQGIENFTGWDRYNLIYLSTHGVQLCNSSFGAGCITFLLTGGYQHRESMVNGAMNSSLYPGVYFGGSSKMPTDWGFEIASSDFFRNQYPTGLYDTLVVTSACQTMIGTDLSDALMGPNTSMLGWDNSVSSNPAVEIGLTFMDFYVHDGLRADVAYQKTLAFSDYPEGMGLDDAGANLIFRGEADTRGREVVTLLHPLTREPLEDGATITTQGAAGDGERDNLMLLFLIDGVDSDQNIGEFIIHLRVNGKELPQTFSATDKVGDYSYQSEMQWVEIPFDVMNDPNQVVTLDAWIDLPEGGVSRHYVEETWPVACGWTATVNGQGLSGIEVSNTYDPALQNPDAQALFATFSDEPFDFSTILNDPPVYILGSDTPSGAPLLTVTDMAASVMLSLTDIYFSETPGLNTEAQGGAIFGTFGGPTQSMAGQGSFKGVFYWHADSRCGFAAKLSAFQDGEGK